MPNDLNLKTSQRLCVILSLSVVIYLLSVSWHEPTIMLLPAITGCALLCADLAGTQVARARFAQRVAAAVIVGMLLIFALKLPTICAVLALT